MVCARILKGVPLLQGGGGVCAAADGAVGHPPAQRQQLPRTPWAAVGPARGCRRPGQRQQLCRCLASHLQLLLYLEAFGTLKGSRMMPRAAASAGISRHYLLTRIAHLSCSACAALCVID